MKTLLRMALVYLVAALFFTGGILVVTLIAPHGGNHSAIFGTALDYEYTRTGAAWPVLAVLPLVAVASVGVRDDLKSYWWVFGIGAGTVFGVLMICLAILFD